MINAEWFQLNQISAFVLLIALLGVWRDRKWLVFLVVVAGSVLRGEVMAALVASWIVWYRSYRGVSRILRVKDSISLFFLIAGSALPSPFREFMICFGVAGISTQLQNDSLNVIPALLLTHLYFGEELPLEIVLSAAAFMVVLKEILILAKVEKSKVILQWLEIPALLCILFPFRVYAFKLLEDPFLIILSPAVLVVVSLLVIWMLVKKPSIREIYLRFQGSMMRWFDFCGKALPNHSKWVHQETPEVVIGIEHYSERFFWGTLTVLVVWFAMILIFKEGVA